MENLFFLMVIGCTGECQGAACQDAFVRSVLAVSRADGNTLELPGQDPLDGDVVLHGGEGLGAGWSLLMGPGHLLVGAPEGDAVLSVDFRVVGEEVSIDDALFGSLIGQGRFGDSIAAVGDLLWVGAPDRDVGRGRPKAGAALLFAGLGRGWQGTVLAEEDALFAVLGEEPYQHLGEQVAACEDIDGDGQPDLLVTAAWDHTGADLGGRVFAVLSSERDELTREVLVGGFSTSWWSTDEGAQLGRSLGCEDLDGDGIQEVLLGAPFADGADGDATGAVYVLQAPFQGGSVEEEALAVLEGVAADSYLGWSLDVGDLDGDGSPEVVAGAPGANGGLGAVGVWGSNFALRTIYRGTESSRFGSTVRLADVDGDGVDDLVVGAPTLEGRAGEVTLWRGDPEVDWNRVLDDSEAPASFVGEAFGELGQAVALGDLDADGDADLVMVMRVE